MAKDRLSGKLAVILHADVASSTALVRQDEEIAHERIRDAFNRFASTIRQYSGQVLELRGDALLAEFERPSDAVSATLAFQATHSEIIAKLNDDLKPEIRAGIAIGEVVVADNTITGAGVVLAQRVEQLAEPGGLCITAAIHEALPLRMPFSQEDLGNQSLKGFEERVRVYRVSLTPGKTIPSPVQNPDARNSSKNRFVGIAFIAALFTLVIGAYFLLQLSSKHDGAADAKQVESRQAEKLSIVVLPFTNMSDDSEQEYFVDGMTEDLITDLSKISALTVISRMSSFTYKGQSPDIRTVSNELGVSHVIEGSVRKIGNQVRISAQLVNATGAQIWGERYDREINDIFALQDEVRSKIVSALAVKLTPAEEKRLERPLTTSVEAYEYYLKALQQISFFSKEANQKSRDLFQQAIDLDPEFAAAYAYLAQAYSLAVENEWTDSPNELIDLAVANAKRGIEIDPDLPFAHWSLARIYSRSYFRDFERSLTGFEKSIALDPNYADGYVMLAAAQIYTGQAEKALGNIEQGIRINPHFPFWYLHTLGQAQFALARYEAAADSFQKAIARNPSVGWPRRWLVATYGHLGKLEDADWEISELEGLGQPFTIETFKNYLPMRDPEYLERLLEGARKAGVPES